MTTYNTKDIAQILNMHPETVREYARNGIIPMTKLNGEKSHWIISGVKFQKWFDEEWSEEYILNTIL
jgi:predicted site-specific integrase-resolvase